MSEIRLDVAEGVAVVTLAAPERRNAFTLPMVAELLQICDRIDDDASVGAVVIRAEGESFCAGAHRGTLAEAGLDPAHPDSYHAISQTYSAFVRVSGLLPPTIAAVRGHAVGAGVNLMLATDIRIIAESAQIISGFTDIGLHPGGGHFALLGRVGGREAAAAMGVFGERVDGRQALRLGLAWATLPASEVEQRSMELARRAAADPELSRAAIRSLRLELGPPAIPPMAALELERAIQMWSLRRRTLKDGVR